MGAVVALYAQEYTQHVSRLVLVCPISIRHPAPYDVQEAAAWEQAEARLDPASVRQLEEMKKAGMDKEDPVAYCREHFRVYTPRQMGKPEALARMKSDPCHYSNEWPSNVSEHWRNHFPPSSQKRDWRLRLESVDIPTLVIHGMKDLIPLAASQEWVTTLPNARLLTISGSGHFPHLEMPEIYFSAIEGFLGGEWPSGSVQC